MTIMCSQHGPIVWVWRRYRIRPQSLNVPQLANVFSLFKVSHSVSESVPGWFLSPVSDGCCNVFCCHRGNTFIMTKNEFIVSQLSASPIGRSPQTRSTDGFFILTVFCFSTVQQVVLCSFSCSRLSIFGSICRILRQIKHSQV